MIILADKRIVTADTVEYTPKDFGDDCKENLSRNFKFSKVSLVKDSNWKGDTFYFEVSAGQDDKSCFIAGRVHIFDLTLDGFKNKLEKRF